MVAVNLKRVHVFGQVRLRNGQEELRLVESHPYLRLLGDSAPYPLYIQDGEVWDEQGERVPEPPEWFWGELALVTPEALAEAGWTRPVPVVARASHPARPLGRRTVKPEVSRGND
jgi:hypothetical protein